MMTPHKNLGASLVVLLASSVLAASDADAQTCSTVANVYEEGFNTTTFRDATTSASGWGRGIAQLPLKGNTFTASSGNVTEKVFMVAPGDYDGDGWTDLAAIMVAPNRLHFLKNLGNNPDGTHKDFSSGGAPTTAGWTAQIIDANIPDSDINAAVITSGDFDGDGDTDILYLKTATQDTSGTLVHAFIYRNDSIATGIPQFTRVDLTSFFQTYRISWHWASNFAKAIDWDKDGRADLVASTSYGTTDSILLFKASPNGLGFQAPITLIVDAGCTPPFADTSTSATGGIVCVPPAVSGFYSRGVSAIAVDDFDNDGDKDIITGSLSEQNLHFFKNDGSDVMTRVADISFVAGGPTFLLNGDLDGDGDSDITVGRDGYNCGGAGGTVWFYANDGAGNFTPRTLPILSDGTDLDFGAIFYVDENLKYPTLNSHPDLTLDLIAADQSDLGTYDQILAQRSTVYNLTGSAISTTADALNNSTNAIVAVTMTGLVETLPSGTGITFSVSNDGGANWEQLLSSEVYNGARPATHTFTHFGSDFRFRADMTTTAATLTGSDAPLAPGSKTTPLLDDVTWEYQSVVRREYSRSALAYASKLTLGDGSQKNVIFSSTFFYPGFQGTLKAFDQSVAMATTTEANNDLNQVIVKSGTGNALLWDAGALLQSRSGGSRTMYTAIPDSNGVVDTRVGFSSGNAGTLYNYMATDQTTAGKVLDFVRNGFGQDDGTKLFDVGHSSPVFVAGVPIDNSANDPSLSADNYTGFVTQMSTTHRNDMVYIGANSGMVHAFLASTGVEQWAFVPYNLLAKLKQEMSTDSSGNPVYTHQYMVDGSVVVRDVFDRTGGTWRTVLIGGQALGVGRGSENYYFGLDVTDPTNPQPLWEFSDPWNADNTACTGALSQTVCTPVPVQTCTNGSCTGPNHQAQAGSNGAIHIDAENYNSATSLDGVYNWVQQTAPLSYTGTGYMEAVPTTTVGTPCTNFTNCGAVLYYSLVSTTRTYQLYIRYQTNVDAQLRFTVGGVDETASLNGKTNGNWTWYKSNNDIPFTAGAQNLFIYMINSGVNIDRVQFIPKGGKGPSDTDPTDVASCANVCVTTGTTQSCTTQNYAAGAESFECGIGSGMTCCAAGTQYFCSPVGQPCNQLDTVLGETWSTPVVAPVKLSSSRTWTVFFGSGYNNRPGIPAAVGRSVYAIDAVAGTLRSRWDYDDLATSATNPSTLDNTIPGGVAVFDFTTSGTDATPDGFADVAYVGDLEGRLWKIDLHQSGSAGTSGLVPLTTWPTCELFDAADQTNTGQRQWAPIITAPAVTTIKQDITSTNYLPYVYFGTGGDDRAPSTLLYRFYAVKDSVTCPPSLTPTTTTAKHEADLTSDTTHLQWIVGDNKDVSGNPLNPSTAEGSVGQRYWSDPVIYQNAVIYFASLDGSIESVNPCDNLTGSSLLYGYAIHDFFSGAGTSSKAGQSIVTLSGFSGTAPYYRSASKIRRSAMIAMQMPTAGVAQPPPANATTTSSTTPQLFIQTFDGNVRSIAPPAVNNVNTIRVLRWREIPLF